mmetsp:Transcript_32126/g.51913  ORF Transcript_32126/g.51913 Transcript_32126/m.51913 type:complete len:101 (-) Transcript_32126:41-343(-)
MCSSTCCNIHILSSIGNQPIPPREQEDSSPPSMSCCAVVKSAEIFSRKRTTTAGENDLTRRPRTRTEPPTIEDKKFSSLGLQTLQQYAKPFVNERSSNET